MKEGRGHCGFRAKPRREVGVSARPCGVLISKNTHTNIVLEATSALQEIAAATGPTARRLQSGLSLGGRALGGVPWWSWGAAAVAWCVACDNQFGAEFRPLCSCRGPQAALKRSHRSDSVTRDWPAGV